jgi:hypothetical protein
MRASDSFRAPPGGNQHNDRHFSNRRRVCRQREDRAALFRSFHEESRSSTAIMPEPRRQFAGQIWAARGGANAIPLPQVLVPVPGRRRNENRAKIGGCSPR